jgi:dimethylhistidine N-methyltransferase
MDAKSGRGHNHQQRRTQLSLAKHSSRNTHNEVDSDFLEDVIWGLNQTPKQLSCKYFYDERGSQLFEDICELDEYYVTRAELSILDDHVAEMAYQIGPGVMLVEFGSGSSVKTSKLLDALDDPVAYVPIDISAEHLFKASKRLEKRYPDIEILPVVADFTSGFKLPVSRNPASHAAVYFPGSTIGNFPPAQAQWLLTRFAEVLGPQGGLLIGIDLQKDPAIIEAAYDDERGVTAEFNLNILRRINRELDGEFVLDNYFHQAVYNQEMGRLEMYLVSQDDASVRVGNHVFEFASQERILTEYSHKYTINGFAKLAAAAQFSLHKYWTDPREFFAVLHLVNEQQ